MAIWVHGEDHVRAAVRRVKPRAAEQGRSMKSLVTEALENTLRGAGSKAAGWRAVFGRAKPGDTRDLERRISELRRVDPKDWE